MINLRVLVPEATTNYITNPSFRYDTTGWNVQGATLTRSLDFARFGIASGKVVTAGVAQREGVYFRVSALAGISENVTVSVYLRGAGKVRLRLDNNVVGGGEAFTQTIELTDRWERSEISLISTGGNDMRLWVESDDTVARAYTFYVDGAQMERKSYATSYCDGDQPGCRWNVTAHGSLSTRTADTRKGGRWASLAGPCRPDNDIYVTLMGGFGMPPVQNQTQSWAQVPGSYYQNQKILDRVVTMNFTVKDEDLRATPPAHLKSLHDLRQQLVDLFKSDVTLNDEPFLFEYSETESTRPLYIEFRYDAGLEGSWDIRNGWYNNFVLRLIAVDPLFKEDNQEVIQLAIKNTINNNNPPASPSYGIMKYENEMWEALGDLDFYCNAIAEAPDGSVYFCGYLDTSSSDGRIYKYDGETMTLIASATGGSTSIRGATVAPDGTLYVVGNFTAINGVAANRIARRNPTTGVWTAMGTGLAAAGQGVLVANNGQVYAVGLFSSAGGISAFGIARWDGQWRTVGATSGIGGASTLVNAIVQSSDPDVLFIGGGFTTDQGGSITYNRVCSVNIQTNLLSQLGYGLSGGVVNTLAVGKDGTLFAGGAFSASGSPGTATLLRIAQYTGGNLWKPMGSGLNSSGVQTMIVDKNTGILYMAGPFTLSGTKYMNRFAKWFNNVLTHMELTILGGAFALWVGKNKDIYVSFSPSAGLITYPSYNNVQNNGSASVFPTMYLRGQGTVRFIGNTKTGQGLYLNLPIFASEEVFIDFARGVIESTVRGNLLSTILPGSEIRSINLLPGDNTIGIYVTDDVSCLAQLRYTPQHWSADAVVNAQDMV